MVDQKQQQTRDQTEFTLVDMETSNIIFPKLLLGVENALTRGNEFIKTNYKQWSELYSVEDIKTNIAEILSQLEEIPTDTKEFLEKTQQELKNLNSSLVHFLSLLLNHIRMHSVLIQKKTALSLGNVISC